MSSLINTFLEDLYQEPKLRVKVMALSVLILPIAGMLLVLAGVPERVALWSIVVLLIPFEFVFYLWLRPTDIAMLVKCVEKSDPQITRQLAGRLREFSEGEEPIVPLLPPEIDGVVDRSKHFAILCFRNL
jgi:hypothetical protein